MHQDRCEPVPTVTFNGNSHYVTRQTRCRGLQQCRETSLGVLPADARHIAPQRFGNRSERLWVRALAVATTQHLSAIVGPKGLTLC